MSDLVYMYTSNLVYRRMDESQLIYDCLDARDETEHDGAWRSEINHDSLELRIIDRRA